MVLASLRLSEEGIKFKTKRKYKEDTSVTNEVCFQAYKPSSFGAKSAVRGVAAVVTNCTWGVGWGQLLLFLSES